MRQKIIILLYSVLLCGPSFSGGFDEHYFGRGTLSPLLLHFTTVSPGGVSVVVSNVSSSTILWGDGSGTYSSPSKSRTFTHTYPAGSYEFRFYATARYVEVESNHVVSAILAPIGVSSNGVRIFRHNRALETIPSNLFINIRSPSFSYAFLSCTNLSEIPAGLFDTAVSTTNFESTFQGCTRLSTVPEGLFSAATNGKVFTRTFYNSGVQSIPSGLLTSCPVTSITGMFYGCTRLTNTWTRWPKTRLGANRTFFGCKSLKSIDPEFFLYGTNVSSFYQTFRGSGVTQLPAEVFRNAGTVSLSQCFMECTNLLSVPAGLFSGATNVTYVGGMFKGCSKLGNIPTNFFSGCPKISSMYQVFSWSAITNIEESAFVGCSNILSFHSTFEGCKMKTVPSNLFYACPLATNFMSTFASSSMTSAPAGLFDLSTNATTFENLFYMANNLVSVPEGLFWNCPKVTTFAGLFSGFNGVAPKITTLPEAFFAYNTNVTSFKNLFYDNRSLVSLPSGIFSNNTKVTTFQRAFYNCKKLDEVPPSLFSSITNIKNLNSTFYGCTNLKTMITNLPINVTNASAIYTYCHSLTTDISGWTCRTNLAICSASHSRMTYGSTNKFLSTGVRDGFSFAMASCALTSNAMDNIMIDLVKSGAINGTLNIGGTNEVPSTNGLAKKAILTSRGWTVTTP